LGPSFAPEQTSKISVHGSKIGVKCEATSSTSTSITTACHTDQVPHGPNLLAISVALLNYSKTTVANAPQFFLPLPTLLHDISPGQIFQAHAYDKPSGSKTGVHLCI
jgi:hypothetical protein